METTKVTRHDTYPGMSEQQKSLENEPALKQQDVALFNAARGEVLQAGLHWLDEAEDVSALRSALFHLIEVLHKRLTILENEPTPKHLRR